MLLTPPDARYLKSYIEFCIGYKKNSIDAFYLNDFPLDALERMQEGGGGDILAGLDRLARAEPTASSAPCSQFWLAEGGEVVGVGDVRHCLNPALEFFGGHISYGVKVGRWGAGMGTALLGGLLGQARELGIKTALLTCAEANAASQRVILKNGGGRLDTVLRTVNGEKRAGLRFLADTGLDWQGGIPLRNHAALYQAEAGEGLALVPFKAVDEGGLVASYYFHIQRGGENAGWLVFRAGGGHTLYFDGNLGYYVKPGMRRRGLAVAACRLMGAKLKRLGAASAAITCDSDNAPSRRVCQRLGAAFLEVARQGGRKPKCRYIWNL